MVVFSPIFAADTKIIYRCNFATPLTKVRNSSSIEMAKRLLFCDAYFSDLIFKCCRNSFKSIIFINILSGLSKRLIGINTSLSLRIVQYIYFLMICFGNKIVSYSCLWFLKHQDDLCIILEVRHWFSLKWKEGLKFRTLFILTNYLLTVLAITKLSAPNPSLSWIMTCGLCPRIKFLLFFITVVFHCAKIDVFC